ncbi:MAG: hypothetical protein IPK68_10440 [Bdellovibrionales bacterium]|nr:hypothetical protein [Bdellovibrionales bacterium]
MRIVDSARSCAVTAAPYESIKISGSVKPLLLFSLNQCVFSGGESLFYQKYLFPFFFAAGFLVLAVEAPASLEDFARVPTFGSSSPGTAVEGRGPCVKQLRSEPRPILDEQLPIGDLTEFVRNDGLSSWFLFLRQAELANSKLSADHIYEESELSQKMKNYSTQVDLFLDSPDVTIDRKLQILIYNLAFVTQLVRNGSDEVADVLRTKLAISDFMVRQIQWLQHPVFTDMILFAYSQFESVNHMGGAGPLAIPPPRHFGVDSAVPEIAIDPNSIPHFGPFRLAPMSSSANEPIKYTVDPDFVSIHALRSLFESLLSYRQGPSIVAETALLIYTIYSRSPLSMGDSRLKRTFLFMGERENRLEPSEQKYRLPLNKLIEDTLRPSLLDFRTHPLITLFFLQLDLQLFETIQRKGRQLSLESANVLKMFPPGFARVLDFHSFLDLFNIDGPPAAPMSDQPASTGIPPAMEDDPQIALYMLNTSGYTYEKMQSPEFLRRYFRRLKRILNSRDLKLDFPEQSNHFFKSDPSSFAIYALHSGNTQPPSATNPLIYNLPSSVARTLVVSVLELFLIPKITYGGVLLEEILSFKIGPALIHDGENAKAPYPNVDRDFASQAQFLRKTLGIPSLLPTSKSLNIPLALQVPVFEAERGGSQLSVFNRRLDEFYKWKLGLRKPTVRTAQSDHIDTQTKTMVRGPSRYFQGPNASMSAPEFDRARAIQLLNDIAIATSPSMASSENARFRLFYASALSVENLKAEMRKLDSDVKRIYQWATSKDDGLIHWMDYLSVTWIQKSKAVDSADLKLVIERLNYDLELYSEIQDLWERYPKPSDALHLGDQLNRSIERTREIRELLVLVFYRLIVGTSDEPKDRNLFYNIRTRMLQIGLDFPDEA